MGLGIAIAINGSPDAELAQAASVEVSERMGQATAYLLRFDLGIAAGDLPWLVDGRLDPGSELSIFVPTDGATECLVKGPVHAQNIHLKHGGGGSSVEVRGADTAIVMDRATQSVVWSNVKDSDAVQTILGNYGYTPDVETTAAMHLDAKHTLVQRESDLSFVRRLARRNGFQFWVTCDDKGVETAHFKRPALGVSAAANLIINLDGSNVEKFDLDWDVERPTSMDGKQIDLNTKTDMQVAVAQTPQVMLGSKGLSAITADTRSVHLSAPADDAGDLQARGEGAVIEADWFVRANCQTTLEKLGTVVHVHTLAEVKGAGSRHSGLYYVAAVKHTITPTEHRMDIELIRNAWNA